MSRKPYPPLEERRAPTLIQKRPGKWSARFRYRGETRDRYVGFDVEPSEGAPPPRRVQDACRRKFTNPYIKGEWSPFEEDARGAGVKNWKPTVAEATSRFLLRYDRPKTRQNYESVLRLFEGTLPSHALASEVTPDDVRGFVYRNHALTKGEERPIRRSTQLHAWRHLRAFFGWCVREGLVEGNPVDLVPRPNAEIRMKPFLPPKDVERLMRACEEGLPAPLSLAYRVALGAGLRRGELRHLQARDVDLDYGILTVRSKEMRHAVAGEFRTKGGRDRRVRIFPIARRALVETLGSTGSPTDPLFAVEGELVPAGRLTKSLASTVDTLDLHLPRPLHALRGLFITYLLLLDWPVPLVQALAGHADSQTTLGYWRDASALLWGEARARFRAEAVALGFEAYSAGGGYASGTPPDG